MFPKINAKQVEKVMKRMGMSQTPIDAKRVTIECEDSNIVIDEPSVMKVVMQGQETFQISGEIREENKEDFTDKDVEIVIEKTGKKEEEVRKALKNSEGDIAEAIMSLS